MFEWNGWIPEVVGVGVGLSGAVCVYDLEGVREAMMLPGVDADGKREEQLLKCERN